MYCTQCGKENKPQNRFCIFCGKPLYIAQPPMFYPPMPPVQYGQIPAPVYTPPIPISPDQIPLQSVSPAPAEKKGNPWVPIIAIGVMAVIGVGAYIISSFAF